MVAVKRYLGSSKTTLIGPNCPGVITPMARARAGIMPPDVYLPGNVGVISRSGTLVYETVDQLTRLGIGQSSSVGVGGDPIIGTTQREALELFEADPDTAAVVMIGEIGGTAEQEAADYIKTMSKPVVAFIAGATAPPGRRMGHAGAIIAGKAGTAQAKQTALMDAGATVVAVPLADRRDDAARAQGARAGVSLEPCNRHRVTRLHREVPTGRPRLVTRLPLRRRWSDNPPRRTMRGLAAIATRYPVPDIATSEEVRDAGMDRRRVARELRADARARLRCLRLQGLEA